MSKLNTNIIKNVINKNILMNNNSNNIVSDYYDNIIHNDDNNYTIINSINILNSSSEIDNLDDKINHTNFITSNSLVQININNFNKPRFILNKNNNNNNNNLKNKIKNINKKINKLEKMIVIFNNNSVLESLLFPKILI